MRRLLTTFALVLPLFAIALNADDFWNKKQPGQWSADEIDRLLLNSPWARPAKVSVEPGAYGDPAGRDQGPGQGTGSPGGGRGGRGGLGRIGGLGIPLPGGGGVGLPGGGGRTPGGRSGGGRDGRTSASAAPKVTVRWDSALPIKDAFGRSPGDDVCRTKSATESEYYTICAFGFPASTQRFKREDSAETTSQDDAEHMKQVLMDQTSLHGKDQSSIFPKSVEIIPMGGTRAVLFMFPKDSRIQDNQELEFDSQVGRLKVKATFKPKGMKYRGKREL
jgi:hypothetical protein